MSVALQKVKHSNHLREWAEMVRLCKTSGLTVRDWCRNQGLCEKTYYHRQKQVCDAIPEIISQPMEFAEVRPAMIAETTDIRIRIGAAEILVDNHSDLVLLRDVLRVVSKTC